jgi:hypothetical protein
MVTDTHEFEETLKKLLLETKTELDRLSKEKEELDVKITSLTEETNGYEIALQNYLKRMGKPLFHEPDWSKVRSLPTHKDRLIYLAQNLGGKINVSEISSQLFNRRIVKSKKRTNVYQVVTGLLNEMVEKGIFQKTKPGEYSLIDSQQILLK